MCHTILSCLKIPQLLVSFSISYKCYVLSHFTMRLRSNGEPVTQVFAKRLHINVVPWKSNHTG